MAEIPANDLRAIIGGEFSSDITFFDADGNPEIVKGLVVKEGAEVLEADVNIITVSVATATKPAKSERDDFVIYDGVSYIINDSSADPSGITILTIGKS